MSLIYESLDLGYAHSAKKEAHLARGNASQNFREI